MHIENKEPSSGDDKFPSLPSVIGDSISEALTGVPAPLKRNVFKAFGRLCSAAIEIPVAQLEGIAAEKKAETAARVRIIETNANQIARQMEVDPEYARVAVRKFGQRIIKEQVNLDSVVDGAARELIETKAGPNSEASEEIDDDWLTQFEKEASQRGAPEVQKLFSRILAGEIQRPMTFSIRSIRILGQLDKTTAELFKRFCSACASLRIPGASNLLDARLVSFGGNAASNALQEFGFSFGALNVLQENGLIISDYNSWLDYRMCVVRGATIALPLKFENKLWGLRPTEPRSLEQPLQFHGVALTKAGQELFEVVDLAPVEGYKLRFVEYLKALNLELVEVRNS